MGNDIIRQFNVTEGLSPAHSAIKDICDCIAAVCDGICAQICDQICDAIW